MKTVQHLLYLSEIYKLIIYGKRNAIVQAQFFNLCPIAIGSHYGFVTAFMVVLYYRSSIALYTLLY